MKADLVVYNADVFTAQGRPPASAFAIWQNRFIDVGTYDDMKPYIGNKTECLDAGGNSVLPGFNDAHCHMASMASDQTLQVDCTPEACSSVAEIVSAVRKTAAETPPGEWIIGFGYDETKIKERRHILRRELDQATTEHPVLIKSFTYHFGVVNSRAFETAGIEKNTADPSGGMFDRDGNGELSGLCLEEAFFMWIPGFSKGEPLIPPYNEEKKALALKRICKKFNELGITSVGDASSDINIIKVCQAADKTGELTVRINMMMHEQNFETMKRAGIRTGFGNERFKVGPIKSFADGACAGRTAWLSTPYGDEKDYYGIRVKDPDEMAQAVKAYHEAGFQISVHANGDSAITMVLDAYEKALSESPGDNHRHRIEHCTFVTESILDRMKKLNVCAAPFANYVITQYDKLGVYSEWRDMMFAHRSFLDHGIHIGASTDYPVVPAFPMVSLQSLVTRQTPDGDILGGCQRIGLEEAINLYTAGSAYLSFEENVKGTIGPGKLADFIILDRNIFNIPASEISETVVVRTVWNGKTVFMK